MMAFVRWHQLFGNGREMKLLCLRQGMTLASLLLQKYVHETVRPFTVPDNLEPRPKLWT
jgi:hypothetical protein